MTEVLAVVRRLEKGRVWVEALPATLCSRCQGKQACWGLSLSRLFCPSSREIPLEASQLVQVGDRVRVGMPAHGLLQAALLAYGFPVLGLIAGAILGRGSETASIVAGGSGFVLAFILARYLGSKIPPPRLLGKVDEKALVFQMYR